jgi:hypothetical protein
MKVEIKQALTKNDCTTALSLSGKLYQSQYSDNEARMLYASAQACNVGIQLYALLDDITNANFGDPDAIIRTFVRLFPSTSSDSKMQSSWFAQDALQSILTPGVVVAPANAITAWANNPGSSSSLDRTLDANTYLLFVSMGVIGTTLNHFGYNLGETPSTYSYGQRVDLPWETLAAVQADTTGAACATASSFFNLFDGIGAIVTYLSGTTNTQLNAVISVLPSVLAGKGKIQCIADGFSSGTAGSQCEVAAERIRYRGACADSAPVASFAAGVIQAINLAWQ